MEKKTIIEIYTDGSILKNPGGFGGYAAILLRDNKKRQVVGSEPDTTNNRMELRAVIAGLTVIKKPCSVKIYTDSKYVMNGIRKWIGGWKKRKWKNSQGKPVANKDLWLLLDRLCNYHDTYWQWVKGHSGDKWNEAVDKLAGKAARDGAEEYE